MFNKPGEDNRVSVDEWRLPNHPAKPASKPKDWRRQKREDRNRPPDFAYISGALLDALAWTTTKAEERLAWYIQGRYSINGAMPFRVNSQTMRRWNITGYQRRRALKLFAAKEKAMITIEWESRKAPVVTPIANFWEPFKRKR